MNSKAQSALEGMISFGIVLIVFMVMYIVYEQQQREVSLTTRDSQERADCFKIANLISTLFVLGKGAEQVTTISNSLTIFPVQQRIETEHTACTFPIPQVLGKNLSSSTSLKLQAGSVHLHYESSGIMIENG